MIENLYTFCILEETKQGLVASDRSFNDHFYGTEGAQPHAHRCTNLFTENMHQQAPCSTFLVFFEAVLRSEIFGKNFCSTFVIIW
jgi:hypothetical protein